MNQEEFNQHLKKYLSKEDIDQLNSSIDNNQEMSCLYYDEEKIDEITLIKHFPFLIKHPLINNAFIFEKKNHDIGKSLLFEIGAFYLLEPCSPLVSYFLNPNEDDLILDMCASPGGKSITTSFIMKNKGQIIANEINSSRAEILSSNVEKYGRKNITVISSDIPSLHKRFKNTFTKIILDAPCSGSGMFRKDEKMKEDWSYQKVLRLSILQKELILMAYDMLKEGGEIIYSTCSYSYEEDEEVIEYLLSNSNAELISLPNNEKFTYSPTLKQTIHLLPHKFIGEGHFIAKIKKPGNLIKVEYPKIKYLKTIKELSTYNHYLNNSNQIYLTNHLLDLKNYRLLRNGINIGTYDNKRGIIYDHNLGRTKLNILPYLEVNEQECKDYIFGLTLNKVVKDGYYVLTYLGIPFAISIASKNTLKNHYPKGLRKKVL